MASHASRKRENERIARAAHEMNQRIDMPILVKSAIITFVFGIVLFFLIIGILVLSKVF